MRGSLVPAKPRPDALGDRETRLVDLMISGPDEDLTLADGTTVDAGWPLTLGQAAEVAGVSLRRARSLCNSTALLAEFNRRFRSLRAAEGPRNLRTAVLLRDDAGDDSAATKAVRLKAIQVIEGQGAPAVTVNVSATANAATVPGYVIRLPAKPDPAPAPAQTDRPALTIAELDATIERASSDSLDR